jgi:MFS transporter, putative metabolite:H+ symporter
MPSELAEILPSRVATRLDGLPLTTMHVLSATVCAVGFGIDLAQISLGNALSAVFSAAPYRLAPLPLAWVLSSVYVGAVIGTPLVGWVAARWGLRRMLQWLLLWLAVTSLLVASGSDASWLGAFRLLSGVALGAYPPLMIAYLTEIGPPATRGTLIFLCCSVAYLVPPGAVFMIRWLTPLAPFGVEGWRWPFVATGVCALAAAAAFTYIPESPRWLLTKRLVDAAISACDRFESSRILRRGSSESPPTLNRPRRPKILRLPDRQLRHPFLFVSGMYFLHPWATSAFPLLTGPVLLDRGIGLTDTLLYIGVATLGPTVGTLCTGLFVDRFERRATLLACALLMLISIVTFFAAQSAIGLLFGVVVFGVGVALYSPAMTVYGAELFPTRSRTAATSAAWALNRLASAMVPLLLIPLLKTHGPSVLGIVVCMALIGSGLLVTFGPAGAAGSPVE